MFAEPQEVSFFPFLPQTEFFSVPVLNTDIRKTIQYFHCPNISIFKTGTSLIFQ